MNQYPFNSDLPPTPEQLAAWADGELALPEVRAVEAWFADHPEAIREAESLQQMTRLYRDHAPPSPCPARWQATLDGLEPRVRPTPRIATVWRLRLLVSLTVASAALVAGVVLARSLWPTTPAATQPIVVATTPTDPEGEDADPFPVSSMSEVHIIHMDAEDADRIVTGQPLIGSFEFVTGDDIDVVKVEPDASQGHWPRLDRRSGMPMIVVAQMGDDER